MSPSLETLLEVSAYKERLQDLIALQGLTPAEAIQEEESSC